MSVSEAEARFALGKVDDEVTRYFTSLGFVVLWDYERGSRKRWYEIYDQPEAGSDWSTGRMLLQVDMGPPLAHILEDLPLLAEGKPGTSASDYMFRGSLDDLKLVAERVAAKGRP